ncbi:unnamed protein product [Haemonchus placei]|uniref:Vegetative cell wall protein gp1-like n=1 Tax=Haemonchus placei TaxID=6290 RepID=A0A0N4X0Q2_HAEPC|nr:unnamed protein product [Haemonchus placei]
MQEPHPAPLQPSPTAPLPPPPSAPLPPPPSVPLPASMEPQPPSLPPPVLQPPEAPREAPFYLTAATRLLMPSALYPQMIPIPFLSGSPSMLFAMPSAPVPSMQGIPAQPQAQLPPTPYTYIPLGETPSAPEVPPPPPPPQGPQLPPPPQPMLSPSPAPLITDSSLSPAPLFATGFPSQGLGPMPTPVPLKAL